MKEHDIRPAALLEQYLALSAADAESCFGDRDRVETNCVACESTKSVNVMSKNGFLFSECNRCRTLFQTPRPSMKEFEKFYKDSLSNKFWSNEFFPAVLEVRREQVFKPRAASLSKSCEKLGIEVSQIADIGAGHGILLEEWRKIHPESELLAIEPSHSMAEICRSKNIPVIEDIVENVKAESINVDLVVSFEVFEHVHDPFSFVRSLATMAGVGNYVFISTLCVDGFDIQTLWEKSNSIFPPHHLNFVSVDGFYKLFNRAGLKIVELSTPGVLDVDIVRNFLKSNPENAQISRFTKKILSSDELSKEFQTFLSENLLSSHVWVFAEVVE